MYFLGPPRRDFPLCFHERRGAGLRPAGLYDSPLKGNGFKLSVPRCLATADSPDAFIRGEQRLLRGATALLV